MPKSFAFSTVQSDSTLAEISVLYTLCTTSFQDVATVMPINNTHCKMHFMMLNRYFHQTWQS